MQLKGGRYSLVEVIGQGRFGTTFKGVDRGTDGTGDTTVAIKVVPLGVNLDGSHQKSQAEVAFLRRLSHPQIPDFIDSFIEGEMLDAKLVLVMAFIDGPTLRQELADTWYDQASVVGVMRDVLGVLTYLHGRSPAVVHGDIKPDNIIRRASDGSLTLIDFGIARAGPQGTGTLTLKGTHGYAPPEAYAGTISPAGDLYALGALAVRLLTNRDLDSLDSNRRLGLSGWQPRVNIGDHLRQLLEDLLAVDPNRRPKSAQAVLKRLDALRDAPAAPVSTPAPTAIVEITDGPIEITTSGGGGDWSSRQAAIVEARTRRKQLEDQQRRLEEQQRLEAERLAALEAARDTEIEAALDIAAAPLIAQIDQAWAELESFLGQLGPDEPERLEALVNFLDEFELQTVTAAVEDERRQRIIDCESLRLAKGLIEGDAEVVGRIRAQRHQIEAERLRVERRRKELERRKENHKVAGLLRDICRLEEDLVRAQSGMGRLKSVFGGLSWQEVAGALNVRAIELNRLWSKSGLTGLDLSYTGITDAGCTHLSSLTGLTSLKLGWEITDAGLAHLSSLTGLTSLDLAYTRITDAGLTHLLALTGLTRLELGSGITDAGLTHLLALTGLTRLELGSGITDAGLAQLSSLTGLCSLKLGRNITDAGLAHLSSLTRLTSLDLSDTRITDAGCAHLSSLTGLTSLELWSGITDAGLAHLSSLTVLTSLKLGRNITDAGCAHLSSLTGLTELYLSSPNITDAGLTHLSSLTGLTSLNLRSTKITDAGCAHLSSLTGLTSLKLWDTKITDAGCAHLSSLTGLTSLKLWDTKITDAGLAHLSSLTGLISLQLREMTIRDAGLAHLSSLTSLRRLTLGIGITDAGCAHLSSMTWLTSLDLRDTIMTHAGVKQLSKALPLCHIDGEGY